MSYCSRYGKTADTINLTMMTLYEGKTNMKIIRNNLFQSQSKTIVDFPSKNKNMSRKQALKYWFGSKTYKEIFKRNLIYISAMRAYDELEMEQANDPLWFKTEF